MSGDREGRDRHGEEPFEEERPAEEGFDREHPDGSAPEDDAFEGTREAMAQAMRRLDVLEWLILAFAIGVALLGGAAVAFLLSTGTGLPFRPTWAVLAVLLLAVPGIFVFGREFWREEASSDPDPDGSGPPSSPLDPRR